MSPELREEVELELAMMRQHLDTFAAARCQAATAPPDPVLKSALGAMLHGFYNGVENIFKRIAIHCDGGPPRGEGSHSALLEQMTRPGPNRPAAISVSLAEEVRKYLRFRHVFRYAYTIQLQWADMADLVRDCQDVLSRLEAEMSLLLETVESGQ